MERIARDAAVRFALENNVTMIEIAIEMALLSLSLPLSLSLSLSLSFSLSLSLSLFLRSMARVRPFRGIKHLSPPPRGVINVYSGT